MILTTALKNMNECKRQNNSFNAGVPSLRWKKFTFDSRVIIISEEKKNLRHKHFHN
jgi:hypothetical protein